MALGRGRRDPLQGRGVGLDARGRAAAAGLGRPGRAAARVRRARARPISAACCSSASRPSASSCAPTTIRRSGSTRRSGWSTSSTTARSSSSRGDAAPRPPRGSPARTATASTSCALAGRGPHARGRRAGARARGPARRRGGLARRRDAGSRGRRRRSRWRSTGARCPRSSSPELDEIDFGSFDGGPLDDVPRVGRVASSGRARPGRRREPCATRPRGSRAACGSVLERPEQVVLLVGHALVVRYVLDAASGLVPRRAMAPVDHASPYRLGVREVEAAPLGSSPTGVDDPSVPRSLGRRLSEGSASRPTTSGMTPVGSVLRLVARRLRARRRRLRRQRRAVLGRYRGADRSRAARAVGDRRAPTPRAVASRSTWTSSFPGADEPFALSGEGAFDEPSERASFAVDMSSFAQLLGGFFAALAGPNARGRPGLRRPGRLEDRGRPGRRSRATSASRRSRRAAPRGQVLDPERRRRA